MAAAPAVARYLDRPGRLPGIDLARGLAVIGMLAAHLLTLRDREWSDPSTWGAVVNGRSSILFAVLAGVSVALVTGGAEPLPAGEPRRRARAALAVRAVLIWLIGLLLVATGVPVYVILPAYGVLFLVALPLVGLRARALWVLAAVLALAMPWLQPAFDAAPFWQGESGEVLVSIVGWHYPATVWCAFLVAGMAAGRSDLARRRTQVGLVISGVALAVVGYGAAEVAGHALAAAPASDLTDLLSAVLSARPHSSGLLEVIGSGGFALAVIGGCCLACRSRGVAAALTPLRAVGSMPLTAYVGQIVVWAIIAAVAFSDTGDLTAMRDLDPFWPFVLGTLVFCTAWVLLRGRGPLETLLAVVTRWVLRR